MIFQMKEQSWIGQLGFVLLLDQPKDLLIFTKIVWLFMHLYHCFATFFSICNPMCVYINFLLPFNWHNILASYRPP